LPQSGTCTFIYDESDETDVLGNTVIAKI